MLLKQRHNDKENDEEFSMNFVIESRTDNVTRPFQVSKQITNQRYFTVITKGAQPGVLARRTSHIAVHIRGAENRGDKL